MNVFISWSGLRSKHIAESLRWWLPNVIQAVKPFMSSHDINKGSRGNVVISRRLEQANVGVICITPENCDARWILFESGALSKLSSAYVCTYLYDCSPSDIEPPLGQFQHTAATKAETIALVQTINGELGEHALDGERLADSFATWWPKLDKKLKETPERPKDEAAPKERSDESKLDELLQLMRGMKSSRVISDPPFRRTSGEFTDLELPGGQVAHLPTSVLENILVPMSKPGIGSKANEADLEMAKQLRLIEDNHGMIRLTDLGKKLAEFYRQ